MKKIILSLFCLILPLTAQIKQYTLEESINLGLKNSKLIKYSNSKLNESKSFYKEINAKFYPHLSLNASYTRLSEVDPFIVDVPFAAQPIKIQDALLNNYSLKAMITQPLFTGFKLSSSRSAAEFNEKAVKVENEDEANKVSLEIKKVYLNFVKIKKTLSLFDERLKSIELHINDSKQYLKNGLITKNELLKLQVLKSETEIKRLEISNNLEVIKSRFNQLLGIELKTETDVMEDLNIKYYQLEKFDVLKNEAIKNRAELKSTRYKIKAASEKIIVAGSEYLPQVNLFASLNYENPNQRIMPLKDEFNETWSAGINLKWNLWNWGETSAKKQQATEKYNQLRLNSEMLIEKIELEVYKKYLKLITENKKVKLAELQLEQTSENFRIVKKKYIEHLVSGSELSDVETDLLDAKIKMLNSSIDRKITEEELFKSLGRKLY